MSKFISSILVITLIAVSCPFVFGDQVKLKNGDRLTGKIIKKDGDKIIIETEAGGRVTLKWEFVESITVDEPINLDLKDGKSIKGKVSAKNDKTLEVATDDGAVEVELEEITAARNEAEQTVYEVDLRRLEHPRFRDFWTGSFDLGFNLKSGNTNKTKLTIDAQGERKSEKSSIRYRAKVDQEREKVDDVYQLTDQELNISASYLRNLNERTFYFFAAGYEFDKFENLDLRTTFTTGIGRRLIQTDKRELVISGGGGYTRENYSDGTTRNSPEMVLAERFKNQFTDRISLEQDFAYYANVKQFSQYRLEFRATVVTRLTNWMGWQFKIENSFNSNPIIDTVKNDFEFTTGLRFNFGKNKKQ